jgi:glycosyltransferase involved in cell wall biosynthesis
MRVAIVHDFLVQDGGAERVLRALHDTWPEAPIFVLVADMEKFADLAGADIRESFLGKIPGAKNHSQWFLPFMVGATEKLDLRGFDVVISETSAFVKGVLTDEKTLHICYCHTPTRYLWSESAEYVDGLRKPRLVKWILPIFLSKLRLWDFAAAGRVDLFVANSRTVADRIRKFYRRVSTVIYPPVDFDKLSKVATNVPGEYYLAGGRLAYYKCIDLVVWTFNRLGLPLKVFGEGPELEHLKKTARPNIEFVGRVSDEEKIKLFAGAKAFIHPQLEDFGITPVESMSTGRPVIAYRAGGAVETVVEGETGIFFDNQDWSDLYEAVLKCEKTVWDSAKIMAQAEQFSRENFSETIKQFVEENWKKYQK